MAGAKHVATGQLSLRQRMSVANALLYPAAVARRACVAGVFARFWVVCAGFARRHAVSSGKVNDKQTRCVSGWESCVGGCSFHARRVCG